MRNWMRTISGVIGSTVACGVFVAGTGPSVASAEPVIPIPASGTIYRLNPDSTYQQGCFPPCLCPLIELHGLRGTFKLTYTGFDGFVDRYAVDDVNWTVSRAGAELRIIGSGIYQIGSPDPATVMQHRMWLDLKVGDEPVEHFDSGWLMIEDMSRIAITVSMKGMYCWDTAIIMDASPVPEDQIHPYALMTGSTFQRGCYNPCDCQLSRELPMVGTFDLVPLEETPPFMEFAVVNVNWRVFFYSVPEVFPITGFGRYSIFAEFAVQHRLALDLVVGSEERTHYDSGLVVGGSEFPRIDAVVSIHGIECFDTLLHVIAEPVEGKVCGGIAGIPCGEGEFCKLPAGRCCCDFFGVCTPIPTVCPDVWNPVCGCDEATYPNECEADAARVSIAYYGECRQVCSADHECLEADEFCKFPAGECGHTTIKGLCVPTRGGCPPVWAPVCGCDGITYENECQADRAGTSVDHRGECEPVCRPTDDGFGCVQVPCSLIPEEQCIPTVLHLDVQTGAITALACECMDFNHCHIEFGDASPFAVGWCPDGGICEVFGRDTDNDGIDDTFTAECVPGLIGACCVDITDGPIAYEECVEVDEPTCHAEGGLFFPINTGCSEIEACCYVRGPSVVLCEDMNPHCCIASGGVPQGPGSTCDNTTCAQICGGFAGIPCEDPNEFCKFPEGTCDWADIFGVCTPIPNGCPDVWEPVCGCDGVTYANECEADRAAVSIRHRGVCGQICGDFSHLPPCPDDEFCKYPEGTCGAHYVTGFCTPFPSACPFLYDPVCGCNGVTYPNECASDVAGVSVAHRGECRWVCCDPAQAPPCPDPVGPYCCADGHWECSDPAGVPPCEPGIVCRPVCGGPHGIPCEEPRTFCKFPVGTCGKFDVFGMCTPIPEGCPEYYDPVCGCDGITYGNECEADAAGVSIAHWGACEPQYCWSNDMCRPDQYCFFHDCAAETGICMPRPEHCPEIWDPVCGCDGITYPNACEAARAGMSVDHPGECERTCSRVDPYQSCYPDEFCKFPPGTCDDPTVLGVCKLVPEACPEVYDPVCGCDGVTYDNECFADMARMSVDYFGECEGPPCAATRDLSCPELSYCPGVPKSVQIHLNPSGATTFSLYDSPPEGWLVTFISHDGEFDSASWEVRWGPFTVPDIPRSVGYTVVPPDNASGVVCFSGEISVEGINQPICGDQCIDSLCCPFMAADLPQPPCQACPFGDCTGCSNPACRDGRITLCELIGYACAWKRGCNDDMAGLTRAAYIWLHGECYCWDDADDNWFPTRCPPPTSGCCDQTNPGAISSGPVGARLTDAGHAVAQVDYTRDGRKGAGRELEIPITVEAPEGTSAMSLDFHIPMGWKVTAISDEGEWDEIHRKAKWGPFSEELSRTVTLTVRRVLDTRRLTARGLKGSVLPRGITGTVSFDGVNYPIAVGR